MVHYSMNFAFVDLSSLPSLYNKLQSLKEAAVRFHELASLPFCSFLYYATNKQTNKQAPLLSISTYFSQITPTLNTAKLILILLPAFGGPSNWEMLLLHLHVLPLSSRKHLMCTQTTSFVEF